MYPVDIWPSVDCDDLLSASNQYLSSMEPSSSENHEWFDIRSNTPHHTKVAITGSNVSRLQMFPDDQSECTVLALHPPGDPDKVLALYLHGKWCSVEDVLTTSSKSRAGLVESAMERVILFILGQVLQKLADSDMLFSLHPRTECGKLLWMDGQAVGFYTFKQKGSLCGRWTAQSYLLPVLDTTLVRRCRRGRGFGLQMLSDFCSLFPGEEVVGLSSPLAPSMVSVCKRFLQQHEEQRERLYEVAEAPGRWDQRRNIWMSIQLGRYSHRTDNVVCF
ncbi:hypothetical protein NHX12_002779 [Muraenolepis orangiensis]|uniref:Family with sequence similarity 169 member B n=1 Tax=Muraenolepis orangiensis TaxID=630683 RepID=A0A9Q0DZ35_9TELE|nr:hypothetical protein NHX12_002779 [Muraenolepis orangiensis]